MNSLGSSGGVVGTPAYIPVEVWEGKKATAAADVYALGCMVSEMVTGEVLFSGETPIAAMRKHDHGAELPPLWPDDVPPELTPTLTRALAKDPAQRQQNAGTFMKELVHSGRVDSIGKKITVTRGIDKDVATKKVVQTSATSKALKIGCVVVSVMILCVVFSFGGLMSYVNSVETVTVYEEVVVTVYATSSMFTTPTYTSVTANPPSRTLTPTPVATVKPLSEVGDIRQFELPSGAKVEMVYVEDGSFMMGSESDEAESDEEPVHEVSLDSFWIDRTEVTNAQFAAFVVATGRETTAEQEGGGYGYQGSDWEYIEGADWRHPQGPGSDLNSLDTHPVVQVSWDDADAFCEWRDARLPTEIEWEKTARGDDLRIYPWGDVFDGTKLNFCDSNCPFGWKDDSVGDGYQLTAPVGVYPAGASPYNALDMAGNVWEWTGSWYDAYSGNSDNNDDYGIKYKVLRGGSWIINQSLARVSDRDRNTHEYRNVYVGFRCASSTP